MTWTKLNISLFNRFHAVNRGEPVRIKQGPHFKVPLKDEKKMVDFLAECSDRDDPRSEQMFAHEITHFLRKYKMPNKFKNGIPGEYKGDAIEMCCWQTGGRKCSA